MMLGAALCLGLAAPADLARAFTPDLPATAKIAASVNQALASYALPTSAFADGQMQTRTVEGPMVQTVWQIDTPDQTTLQMLAPLRTQLLEAGFSVVFECETAGCGGFDFRYGTPVLPEPDMHIDLGNFRFLSATKADEAVSLLVSRSAATGFVQLTQVGGTASTPLAADAEDPPERSRGMDFPINAAAAPDDIGSRLSAGLPVSMDDLVFASGASALSEGVYPSLVALAEWLVAHPDLRVALVGHTDASGGLDVNIAVSRRRAQSVRQRLIDRYAIPAQQIEAEGVGYLAPRASNLTDAGREQNRRVEAVVTSTPVSP